MEFSIVITLFNEAESLGLLQQRLSTAMNRISNDYEVIYVDDGSRDSSLETLKALRQKFPAMRIISFRKNKGQSVALYAGLKSSRGKWIITLDADGQNPPEEIIRLLEFQDRFDFIAGIRKRRKDNFVKKISSLSARFFRWLVLDDTTKDTGCSLRLFKREIIDSLTFFYNFHRFFTFLVRTKGFLVKEVYVAHSRRMFGKSKYGICKRLKEGICDLLGVYWIKSRMMDYDIKYEC